MYTHLDITYVNVCISRLRRRHGSAGPCGTHLSLRMWWKHRPVLCCRSQHSSEVLPTCVVVASCTKSVVTISVLDLKKWVPQLLSFFVQHVFPSNEGQNSRDTVWCEMLKFVWRNSFDFSGRMDASSPISTFFDKMHLKKFFHKGETHKVFTK